MKRIEPDVSDYERLEFPVFVSEEIKCRSGQNVRFNHLERGDNPVSRLSLVWKTRCDNASTATSKIMARSLRDGANGLSNSKIDKILDFNGAILTSARANDHIVLNVLALTKRLKEILPIVSTIVSAPTFPIRRLKFIKELLADNQRLLGKKVDYIALTKLYELILGVGHPRAKVLTPDDFLAVGRVDVIESYKHEIREVVPTVWLAGALDNETIDAVRNFVCTLTVDGATGNPAHGHPYIALPPGHANVKIEHAKQTAVSMGTVVPIRPSSQLNMLRITAAALGGHFRSRLNMTVREQLGLTYGIYSSVSYNPDGAVCLINAQTSLRHVEKLIEVTNNIIDSLVARPLTDEEILDVRRQIISSLASLLDNPMTLVDQYINLENNGLGLDFLYDYEDKALNLTASEIASTARRYLRPSDFSIVTAG